MSDEKKKVYKVDVESNPLSDWISKMVFGTREDAEKALKFLIEVMINTSIEELDDVGVCEELELYEDLDCYMESFGNDEEFKNSYPLSYKALIEYNE